MKDTPRCGWCLGHNDYIRYHDQEWGVPVKDDEKLFEFLTLESFQAGLSWITVLRKRERFRKVLDGFDYKKIANYNDQDIDRLIQDKGIIRNRLKIKAVISNAKAFMDVQNEFGSFSTFIWSYVNNIPFTTHGLQHQKFHQIPPYQIKLARTLNKEVLNLLDQP